MALIEGSIAISGGATSIAVTGGFPTPPYTVAYDADWNTTHLASAKLTTGFTDTFGTAAPGGGGTLRYFIVGSLAGPVSTSLTVVNNALLLIGDQTITSLGQDVPRAVFMNALYVPTLDEVLRMHNWNFAQVRATVGPLLCAPAWDFAYQFALPCSPYALMILETNMNADDAWRIEWGRSCATAASTSSDCYRVLVTDGCLSSLLYIGRIDDVSMRDPLFTDAFTYELAFRAAYPLTRNATLADVLRKEKEERWRLAKSRDGQEGRHRKSVLSTSLTSVR